MLNSIRYMCWCKIQWKDTSTAKWIKKNKTTTTKHFNLEGSQSWKKIAILLSWLSRQYSRPVYGYQNPPILVLKLSQHCHWRQWSKVYGWSKPFILSARIQLYIYTGKASKCPVWLLLQWLYIRQDCQFTNHFHFINHQRQVSVNVWQTWLCHNYKD